MFARASARLGARLMTARTEPLALALSGGGDSMALLHITAAWAGAHGRRLIAITVDHGLNPASADWSRTCERAARSLDADWIERRWMGDKPMTGLTAAARQARHALIADAARGAGARVVLMGHTADDIDEADWMRARSVQDGGSTLGRLRDWSPSPAWPESRGLMLFRPLLEERRQALRDLLRATGQDWIEDPANLDPRFGRSRARAALAGETAFGGVTSHFPTLAPTAIVPLPLGAGFAVTRSLGLQALAVTLLSAAGTSIPPRGTRLSALNDRLRSGQDFSATLCGARVETTGSTVVIGRDIGEFKRRMIPDLTLSADQPAVWDGRYEITIRAPGWSVEPAAGRMSALPDRDKAMLKTIPAVLRPTLPVLFREGQTGPVLAWRVAQVRALAPRRLALAVSGLEPGAPGQTTHEANLFDAIHGETPPTDLFSLQDHQDGSPTGEP
ncbi:tRNA lysidine(34) synthetase TilS [soil metagenome]